MRFRAIKQTLRAASLPLLFLFVGCSDLTIRDAIDVADMLIPDDCEEGDDRDACTNQDTPE